MKVGRALAVALLATGSVAACDSDPSGPGSLDARVLSGETGAAAAVVEVSGSGIRGLEAAGDTRAYAGQIPENPDLHRVVLVNPGAGDLRFRIRVDDRGARLPSSTVVFAADTANAPVHQVGELEVLVER